VSACNVDRYSYGTIILIHVAGFLGVKVADVRKIDIPKLMLVFVVH